MNELLPEIQNRFSCRRYIPGKTLELPQINLLLEAAGRTPSGCNMQPWSFVVVRSKERMETITNNHTFAQDFLKNAACLFVVLGSTKVIADDKLRKNRLDGMIEDEAITRKEVEDSVACMEAHNDLDLLSDDRTGAIRDCAMATYGMMLQATHMGLGSCWITVRNKEGLKQLIQIDVKGMQVVCILAVGYPEPSYKPRRRMPLSEYATIENI